MIPNGSARRSRTRFAPSTLRFPSPASSRWTGPSPDSVAQPRFRTTLVALFAAAALLLAVIGIYGVLSYSVGRRTREVGIRMALGAGRPDILRLILLEGVALMGAGLAAGLVGAVVLTRYLSTMLFDVRPIDPLTYAAVAGVLLAAGVSACLVPAGRATRVDPIEALRYE